MIQIDIYIFNIFKRIRDGSFICIPFEIFLHIYIDVSITDEGLQYLDFSWELIRHMNSEAILHGQHDFRVYDPPPPKKKIKNPREVYVHVHVTLIKPTPHRCFCRYDHKAFFLYYFLCKYCAITAMTRDTSVYIRSHPEYRLVKSPLRTGQGTHL